MQKSNSLVVHVSNTLDVVGARRNPQIFNHMLNKYKPPYIAINLNSENTETTQDNWWHLSLNTNFPAPCKLYVRNLEYASVQAPAPLSAGSTRSIGNILLTLAAVARRVWHDKRLAWQLWQAAAFGKHRTQAAHSGRSLCFDSCSTKSVRLERNGELKIRTVNCWPLNS